jgi:predicted Zn-dependent protease
MPRVHRFLLLLFLPTIVAACQSDPVTGKAYYSPLGNDYVSQDRHIRRYFLTEQMLVRDGGLLPEPEMEAACREMFRKVVAALPPEHRRDFRFHFYLTTAPDINAYTYGGGRIHCHLGLVARVNDAAEFAGVMAHEIGHNSHDHIGQGLGRQSLAMPFIGLGGLAGRPGRQLAQSITGITLIQFTRKQEQEADDRAVDYARTAGIDPDGVARFFAGLEKDYGADIRQQPQFMQSHPYPENRVQQIRARIQELPVNEGALKSTPAFDAAIRRAREILPFYAALHEALRGDDLKPLLEAANAGAAALPHHPQFHFWRGVALEAEGERGLALAALRRADELDRRNLMTPLLHCHLELVEGHYPEAELAAGKVIAIVPAVPSAYLVRGAARAKQGDTEAAYDDFDRALALTPSAQHPRAIEVIRSYAPDYRRG